MLFFYPHKIELTVYSVKNAFLLHWVLCQPLYNPSPRAITVCAKREKWAERLENIEKESRQMSDKKLAEAMQEMRERHLRTIRAMNVRALEAMKQYPLATGMEAMRAAEMAIKLERLIAGEPTERTANMEEIVRREYERWMTGDDEDGDEEPEKEPEQAGSVS